MARGPHEIENEEYSARNLREIRREIRRALRIFLPPTDFDFPVRHGLKRSIDLPFVFAVNTEFVAALFCILTLTPSLHPSIDEEMSKDHAIRRHPSPNHSKILDVYIPSFFTKRNTLSTLSSRNITKIPPKTSLNFRDIAIYAYLLYYEDIL